MGFKVLALLCLLVSVSGFGQNETCGKKLFGVNVKVDVTFTEDVNHRISVQLVNPEGPGKPYLNHLVRWLDKPLGVREFSTLYQKIAHNTDPNKTFYEKWFEATGSKAIWNPNDLLNIPKEGPLLVTLNHPLSGIDAIAAAQALTQVRKDIKIMMTDYFKDLSLFQKEAIFVNTRGGSNSPAKLQVTQWLQQGHVVVLCPAGEVSVREKEGTVTDPEWKNGVSYFAKKIGCPVLPVFVYGEPTDTFLWLREKNSTLSADYIIKEIIRQKSKPVYFAIGKASMPEEWNNMKIEEITEYLRQKVYSLKLN